MDKVKKEEDISILGDILDKLTDLFIDRGLTPPYMADLAGIKGVKSLDISVKADGKGYRAQGYDVSVNRRKYRYETTKAEREVLWTVTVTSFMEYR